MRTALKIMMNASATLALRRFLRGRLLSVALTFGLMAVRGMAQTLPAGNVTQATGTNDLIVLPEAVPDPIEPFNRVMWAFNKTLLVNLIHPTSKVYRRVVVKPVRTSISRFAKNLTYPPRLLNNMLTGNWSGARDESYRFLCNSTVGVAGFWDVATRWGIPKSEAS